MQLDGSNGKLADRQEATGDRSSASRKRARSPLERPIATRSRSGNIEQQQETQVEPRKKDTSETSRLLKALQSLWLRTAMSQEADKPKWGARLQQADESSPLRALKLSVRRLFGVTGEQAPSAVVPAQAAGKPASYGTANVEQQARKASANFQQQASSGWPGNLDRRRLHNFALAKYKSVASRATGGSGGPQKRRLKWSSRAANLWPLGLLLLTLLLVSSGCQLREAAPIVEPLDSPLELDTASSHELTNEKQTAPGQLQQVLLDRLDSRSVLIELATAIDNAQEAPLEVEQALESLEVERRRLNRDRALEPAPWLREQPMRRNGLQMAASHEDQEDALRARRSTLGADELLGALLSEALEAKQVVGFVEPSTSTDIGRLITNNKDQLAASGVEAPTEFVLASGPLGGQQRLMRLQGASGAPRVEFELEPEIGDTGEESSDGSDSDNDKEASFLQIVGVPVASASLDPPLASFGGLVETNRVGDIRVALAKRALGATQAELQQHQQQQQQQTNRELGRHEPPAAPARGDVYLFEAQLEASKPRPAATAYPAPSSGANVLELRLGQLVLQIVNELRVQLELVLRIPAGSIADFWPVNEQQLLVKLDPSRLSEQQLLRMIAKYDSAGSNYILLSWPKSNRRSPIPRLVNIGRLLQDASAPHLADGEARAALGELARQGRLLTNFENERRQLGDIDDENGDDDDDDNKPAQFLWLRERLQQDGASFAGDATLEQQRLDDLTSYLAAVGYLEAFGQLPAAQFALARGRNVRAEALQDRRQQDMHDFWSGLAVQFSALLLAVLGAAIAVKLTLCKGGFTKRARFKEGETSDSQLSEVKTDSGETKLERVSQQLGAYWTSASSTCSAVLENRKRPLKASEAATENKPTANIGDDIERNESPLAGKLTGFLFKRSRGSEVDELDSSGSTKFVRDGKFRSSRSYIKSLIDALAATRAAETGAGAAAVSSAADGDELASNDCSRPVSQPTSVDCLSSSQESAGLESQMDISSAHLILAYMERHLEDKEQLRREWLELNAASPRTTAAVQATNSARINKLLLERLAKVGTSKENLAKNYNPVVVAFDRNRVKLRGCPWLQPPSNKQDRPLGSDNKPISDYYNASYIYDDEPRKPAYIMSQGPTEQTVAQFWQMIWEQGVSVVVMLTRLNENNTRQCHCYWPASETEAELQQAAAAPSTAGTRRASVTSVSATPTAAGQQPIVAANTGPGSKVIYFEVLERPKQTTSGQDDESKTKRASPARFEVHLVSEHVTSSDYLVRNMYIINRLTGETRTISQFHYLAWPEAGVPANVKGLLSFRRKVHKSFRAPNSPILVHCSDGSGRSGAYVLIDLILERIKTGAKEIDLRASLEHLRDQRIACCATQKQFEFALVALAEEIQLIVDALPQ